MSLAVMNSGLLSTMTHVCGEKLIWQLVKAYNPSIVWSGETPLGR